MLLKRQIALNVKILKSEICRLNMAIESCEERGSTDENMLKHIEKMKKQISDIRIIIKSYE